MRDLDPRFQPYAKAILAWLQRQDPAYHVSSGRRSTKAQEGLYRVRQQCLAGDPKACQRQPYTVAPPGCSKHQMGFAIDVVSSRRSPFEDPYLRAIGQYWRSIGGEWGGEKDPIHFALPGRLCT